MTLSKVVFLSSNAHLTARFSHHLARLTRCLPWTSALGVSTYTGSILSFIHHASEDTMETGIATPGNSLAFMNGGFDQYVLEALCAGVEGTEFASFSDVEACLRQHSLAKYNGYLPAYAAVNELSLPSLIADYCEQSLAFRNHHITSLLHAPTMIVPQPMAASNALTSIFNTIWQLCLYCDAHALDKLILPGFGSGYGGVDPDQVARVTVAALVFYHLQPVAPLFKSTMILMLLRQNWRLFDNEHDLSLIKDCLTDYGINMPAQSPDHAQLMDWDEWAMCLKFST